MIDRLPGQAGSDTELAGVSRGHQVAATHCMASLGTATRTKGITGWILDASSGWLISAVVHGMILVALAMWTFSSLETQPAGSLLARIADDVEEIEFIEPIEIESELEKNQDLAFALLTEPSEGNSSYVPVLPFSPTIVEPTISHGAIDDIDAIFGEGGGKMARIVAGTGGADFYGVQASGNRFVFIVDSSRSMLRKFDEAKRELEYAVRRLSKEQLFYVIFFDQNAAGLTLGRWNENQTKYVFNNEPETGLVPATAANVSGFVRWMNTIELDFMTNPYGAVEFAVNNLRPDAIYILSDGEFTDRGMTEHFLRQNNLVDDPIEGRRAKVVVHTIGFYSRDGEVTLKRIAQANGGSYRFVSPPPGHVDPRAMRRRMMGPRN